MWDGPNSYRALSLVLVSPFYAMVSSYYDYYDYSLRRRRLLLLILLLIIRPPRPPRPPPPPPQILLTFGTLAGRHLFFAAMAEKIVGRFLPRAVSSRLFQAVKTGAAKAASAPR